MNVYGLKDDDGDCDEKRGFSAVSDWSSCKNNFNKYVKANLGSGKERKKEYWVGTYCSLSASAPEPCLTILGTYLIFSGEKREKEKEEGWNDRQSFDVIYMANSWLSVAGT